jgi:hypothetical protein
MHLPIAFQVLLEADVPVGGKPISVEVMARRMKSDAPRGEGAWQKCEPNAACLGVGVPAGLSISNYSVDSYDKKSLHYGVLVTGISVRGGPPPNTYVRLVVKYTTAAEFCVSQQSWEMRQDSSDARTLMIPEGRTPLGFDTFASVVNGAGEIAQPGWNNCDVWEYPGTYLKKDQCLQGNPGHNPGAIGFDTATIDEDGYIVWASTARGFLFACNNNHFNRRACRAQLRYK